MGSPVWVSAVPVLRPAYTALPDVSTGSWIGSGMPELDMMLKYGMLALQAVTLSTMPQCWHYAELPKKVLVLNSQIKLQFSGERNLRFHF